VHKQNKLVRQRACTISSFEISALPDTNYELPTTDTELAIYQSTTDLDNTFFAAFFLLPF